MFIWSAMLLHYNNNVKYCFIKTVNSETAFVSLVLDFFVWWSILFMINDNTFSFGTMSWVCMYGSHNTPTAQAWTTYGLVFGHALGLSHLKEPPRHGVCGVVLGGSGLWFYNTRRKNHVTLLTIFTIYLSNHYFITI